MENFIKTQDLKVANELKAAGYPELNKEGNFFVFVNIGNKFNFTKEEKKNVVFTNILHA